MTVQFPQVLPPAIEANLFGDTAVPNNSDRTFQQLLENEQQRLGLSFSPLGQFNFTTWFSYPDFSFVADSADAESSSLSEQISKIQSQTLKIQELRQAQLIPTNRTLANQAYAPATSSALSSPAQTMLQEILLKTGWLAPNLAAQPLFTQARQNGLLLANLDLQFLIDEILTQVQLVKDKGKTELSLGLKPENLGEILLTLTSKSGLVSIQIQAPEEARKLLTANLRELELALKKSKINLAELKIIAIKEATQDV